MGHGGLRLPIELVRAAKKTLDIPEHDVRLKNTGNNASIQDLLDPREHSHEESPLHFHIVLLSPRRIRGSSRICRIGAAWCGGRKEEETPPPEEIPVTPSLVDRQARPHTKTQYKTGREPPRSGDDDGAIRIEARTPRSAGAVSYFRKITPFQGIKGTSPALIHPGVRRRYPQSNLFPRGETLPAASIFHYQSQINERSKL